MADMIHWQAIQFSKRCSEGQRDLRRRAKNAKTETAAGDEWLAGFLEWAEPWHRNEVVPRDNLTQMLAKTLDHSFLVG